MRDDMHKKVIERSRWASDWADNGSVRHDRQRLRAACAESVAWEDLPARSRMKPRRGIRRGQTDTLKPLQRFLQAHLGQPWDAVYRELREHLSPDSVIHMHIFQHLDQMVCRHVWLDGERVYSHRHRIFQGGELFFRWGGTFYVHPETGRLCQPTRRWRRDRSPALPPLPRIDQGDGRMLLQVEGLWYAVQTMPYTSTGWDVFSHAEGRTILSAVRIARYGGADLLAATKRVLSRAEKRRAGLLDSGGR
jgi:hypothetical protein